MSDFDAVAMRSMQVEQARQAPTPVEYAMQEIDAKIDTVADRLMAAAPPMMPRTVLTGESHDAYAEFCSAAAALESHQKQSAVLMERYKAALQRLSEQAAKAGR